MDMIDLPATDKTPAIRFVPKDGVLEISGCSIHENADRFFKPLLDNMEAYAAAPARQTSVRLALTYFNSSSAKYLLDVLKMLDEAHVRGTSQVLLTWEYEEGDLDMQEAGEDFIGLLEMPVKLVER
jgi:hypothetical protein